MIKLLTFPPAFGLSTVTPFGTKVETYLRIAGLRFERIATRYPRNAPKGKLPVIVDDDGSTIADSGIILEHLEKKHGRPLDGKLDDDQRALGHLVRRTFEESFYWVAVWLRWGDAAGWARTKAEVFDVLPIGVRTLAPPVVRRIMRGQLHAQGTGRHSPAEIHALGKADLTAISRILGSKTFILGGESPTTVDCTAYGFLAQLLFTGFEGEQQAHARALGNLEPYAKRIHDKWWA